VSLPVILASQMMAFFVVGVYRGVWRHFGMMDSLVIARGVLFGTIGAQLFSTTYQGGTGNDTVVTSLGPLQAARGIVLHGLKSLPPSPKTRKSLLVP